jgi:phospholipase/carboxylesterase
MFDKSSTVFSGKKLEEASAAMIMLHGRGASAESILTLAEELNVDKFVLAAPRARENTWYPNSFLSPIQTNQPFLDQSLKQVAELENFFTEKGFTSEQIYYLGFSQGACLALEYCCRNAKKYGGIFALSGGLIGAQIEANRYSGNFHNTTVFLACGDSDFHIPVGRIRESETIISSIGGKVTTQIYPGFGHSINRDELDSINKLLSIKNLT